jgi:type I restriction enzyme M protein
MREANILYLVVCKFCDVDLHPNAVPNEQMGLIFENLIRRFNELANETAGDHFTPREVIRLMVSILFIDDDRTCSPRPAPCASCSTRPAAPAACWRSAQNYLREHHGAAKLYVYGQDYNKRAFATAASDMLMKQVDHNGAGNNVRYGDSFTEDQFAGETFDYFLTNPPFGVDWKKQQKEIQQERDKRGFDGRFGAGLPRVNDGSLLFLQHMVDKFEPVRPAEHKHGSRLAIVFSGSPLFTGGAGSGESDIRKWIIENDWLEPSSPCRSRCSTTPASAPTSGSSPTARPSGARARSSSSMRAACGPRAAARTTSAASATSAGTSPNSQIAEIVKLYGRLRPTARPPGPSTTPTSATPASPSSGPCACATR